MTLELVLITGMSGSGKSVALHALEDAGYFCVDNLPPELLLPFVELEQHKQADKVAIAMDVRSAQSLPLVPAQLADLRGRNVNIRLLFLDATTDTLVRRFSETRRRHPLSRQHASGQSTDLERDVIDAIEMERSLLGDLREESHIIDTSLLRNAKLQSYIKSLISAPATQLTLMFESFVQHAPKLVEKFKGKSTQFLHMTLFHNQYVVLNYKNLLDVLTLTISEM